MPHRPSKTSARSAAPGGPDLPADFADHKVAALPIIANFCQQLGVTRTVDAAVDPRENIGSGQVVAGMVMDTLSGRSPLYKLHEHFAGQDMELLFRADLKPGDFNDNNVGKVLDNIHAYGASRLFSQIAWEACGRFGLDGNRHARAGSDPSKARPRVRYKLFETTVTLYGIEYRAVVVHSSAHDKRRLKKLDKQLAADREAFRKLEKELAKTGFACEGDARRHAGGLAAKAGLKHHGLDTRLVAEPVYARGRPPKGRPRKIKATRQRVEATLVPDRERIDALRERSGCFVLISNLPDEGENAHTGTEILRAYKEQYGIGNNFRFLKEPLIVNDTFLKKAERIEALGFILPLSLMVCNLVQLVIRRHLRERGSTILGWDNKQTTAPTTMMVFHYFQHISVYVWNAGRNRRLSRPLLDHQRDYLGAMGLPESIFATSVKTYRN